ncbi:MAG: hypothetical protein NZ761_03485 [Dehalococcoidia bacterium]|nr:hypothetical protein [Dehalococcoidia bacterium]
MFAVQVKMNPDDLPQYLTKRAPQRLYKRASQRLRRILTLLADRVRENAGGIALTGGLADTVRVEEEPVGEYVGLYRLVVTGDESGYAYVRPGRAYAAPVEFGAAPHRPPLGVIVAWAETLFERRGPVRHSFTGEVLTPFKFGYLVAEAIEARGLEKQEFVRRAMQSMRDELPPSARAMRAMADDLVREIAIDY